ncbi:Phosphorylase b kinase gamma catalytic chain, liver/testis isoform, partial [Mortierella sp. AD032]
MELASMSLQQKLMNRISLEEAQNISREIAVGLKTVHAKNVVHRDIKADNILISDTTGQALICDFGLSGYLPTPSSQLEGRCGTRMYWAREMRDNLPYGTKVDCFAMGTITRRLLENVRWDPSMPLEEIDDKKAEIMDLVNHLLEEEPESRYSAEQALQHTFFLKQEHQEQED